MVKSLLPGRAAAAGCSGAGGHGQDTWQDKWERLPLGLKVHLEERCRQRIQRMHHALGAPVAFPDAEELTLQRQDRLSIYLSVISGWARENGVLCHQLPRSANPTISPALLSGLSLTDKLVKGLDSPQTKRSPGQVGLCRVYKRQKVERRPERSSNSTGFSLGLQPAPKLPKYFRPHCRGAITLYGTK